jgi:Na+-driven multidrug efflux pump
VIKSVSALAPLVSVFISCDGVQGVAQGITRGTAMQNWGATFVIVANYFIALPLGFFLAFVPHAKLGLFGLWSGTSSMSMVDTYFFNLILRMTEYFTNLM